MKRIFFKNAFSQARGLMFTRPANDTLYIFDFQKPVRHSFHMFFVFSPIDLYLLDADGTILEIRRNFRPFTTHKPKTSYSFAVETRPKLLKYRVSQQIPLRETEH